MEFAMETQYTVGKYTKKIKIQDKFSKNLHSPKYIYLANAHRRI